MSDTVNLEGPSGGTGKPKIVPPTINAAINAALAQKAAVADVLAVTAAADAALEQKASVADMQAAAAALLAVRDTAVANQQAVATQTPTIASLTAALALLQGRLTGVEGRATVLETAVPPPATPNVVASFSLGATTTTTQVLNWTAPAAGAAVTFYDTQVAPVVTGVTGTWAAGPTVAVGTLTATVTGRTQGTLYDYRVTTRNAAGPGVASAALRKSTTPTFTASPAWTSIPPSTSGITMDDGGLVTVVNGAVQLTPLGGVIAPMGSSSFVFDVVKADTGFIFQGSNAPGLPPGGGYWFWSGTPPNWVFGANPRPVVPGNSTPKQQMITYLNSISGNHILSGQMGHANDSEFNADTAALGFAVAIKVNDPWVDQWPGNYLYDVSFVSGAIAHANAGGIIGVNMALPNPAGGGGSQGGNPVNAEQILTAGTAQNLALIGFLNQAATDVLIPLKNAGKAVLLRYLWELDGNWFWWGTGFFSGSQQTRLYRLIREYFTITRGLDNLIFCFAVNGGPGTYQYPGDDLVDAIGPDVYTNTVTATYLNLYNQIRAQAPTKPFLFMEWGAGNAGQNNPAYVTSQLIIEMEASFPRACGVIAWPGWNWNLETNPIAGLTRPSVINRAQVHLP